jgi:hypothetical protein
MGPLTVFGACTMRPAVHRWLGTLRRHFDGRCLLVLTHTADDETDLGRIADDLSRRYGVEVRTATIEPGFWYPKPTGGVCGQWGMLHDACLRLDPAGHVLRTDVWDVVFQDDPRKYIDFGSSKIAVSPEGFRLGEEPINRGWTARWAQQFAAADVVNGGLVCGPVRSVAVLGAIVARCPLDTPVDQSELSLLSAAFPGAFEYRRGFLECMYGRFDAEGQIVDGKIGFRDTGRPWCVAHANGGDAKQLLDRLYPMDVFGQTRPEPGTALPR